MEERVYKHWREQYFNPNELNIKATTKPGQIADQIYASYMILVDSMNLDEEQTKALLTNINYDTRKDDALNKMNILIKDFMNTYALFDLGKMNMEFIVLRTTDKQYIVKGEQELKLIIAFLKNEIELGGTNLEDFLIKSDEIKYRGYDGFEPFTFTKTNIQMPEKASLSEMEMLIGRYEEADTGLIKVIKDIENIFMF